MTTQAENSTPANSTAFTVCVWDIVPCVLWAALALLVQHWWIHARDTQAGAPIYLTAAGLGFVYLALFAWAVWQKRKLKKDPEKLAALAAAMRPLFSLAGIGGGILVILLAVWLCLAEKERLLVFGEVSSLAVLGMICLGGGLSLRMTEKSLLSRQRLLEVLLKMRMQLGPILIGLGLILAVLGGYFFIRAGRNDYSTKFPGGPEGIGLFLMGLALFAGGLWTQLTLGRPATAGTMRILVLYLGSTTGLAIVLGTALRLLPWWNRSQSWQGEVGWHLWYCGYVGLFGLLLVFSSLLLARTDIRTNPGVRRLLYGYNAFLNGLLLLGVLIVLNLIVSDRLPGNIQWTASLGMHSLSERAAFTLANLKQKVTVFVLMPNRMESSQDVRDLLDNCQGVTSNLEVEYVAPDLDRDRYRTLVKTYPELRKRTESREGGSGLLVVYGDAEESKRGSLSHRFVPDKDLDEEDMQAKARYFNGEKVLIQAIAELAENNQKTKVYFTQWNGESWINDQDVLDPRVGAVDRSGAGVVVGKLRKDNYEVQGLIFKAEVPRQLQGADFVSARKSAKDKPEIPEDCKVLVVINPIQAFPKDVMEAIDRYLDRGGKLMVLTKAGILPATQASFKFAEDGMEELCKKVGVQVTNDIVLKASARNNADVVYVKATVPPNTSNIVGRRFIGKSFLFFMPRTVRPLKGTTQFQADVLLQATDAANGGEVWTETELSGGFLQGPLEFINNPRNLAKIRAKSSADPTPLAVAVTDRENKPRAVVMGEYSFISSDEFLDPQPGQAANYEFFRSCVEWLAERKIVTLGMPPVERKFFALSKEDANGWRLIALPLGLTSLVLAGIGTGIWIVRRK